MTVRGDVGAGPVMSYRDILFVAIEGERGRQDRKWGDEHDRQHAALDWARIICTLAINAAEEDQSGAWDETVADHEIIKIAAVALAWMEARQNDAAIKKAGG